MYEQIIHALETGQSSHLTDEQKAGFFQELLAEYLRVKAWADRCLGKEIASWGAREVDPENF